MKRYLPFFVLCSLGFIGTARGGDSAEIDDANTDVWIAHLQQCTAKIFSLTGLFSQDFECGGYLKPTVLRGSFEVRRNGSCRLTYTEPQGRILVSNGTISSMLHREDRWTSSGPVDTLPGEIAAVLTGRLPETLQVDFLGGAESPSEGLGVVRFHPQNHRFIQSVLVTIAPQSPCILRVTVVDTGGCIIRTTLESVRVNTGVKAKRFQLQSPKNNSVLEP